VLVSSSWANAAPSIGDDGRSTTTKPPGEMLVAQAWWDAAYNAATAQRQTPTQQGVPLVRSESRRYGDSSQTHSRPRRPWAHLGWSGPQSWRPMDSALPRLRSSWTSARCRSIAYWLP